MSKRLQNQLRRVDERAVEIEERQRFLHL
jgi:hypothetical protein